MVKHIVFWKLKESAHGNSAAENAKIIKEKLEALGGKIDGLIHIEVGLDFSAGEASCDLALYSEFKSKEALSYYQEHPLHKAILPFVAEARTERRVVDYEK
ncbi:Stress responsive alpha-beta barrel domain protein Dabb [Chitinispirillum alkaliphilum]|nr:Stress responsive alpha-beta barrel domain protein Dabb [Chitinispirillum alkaliphilum]